MKTFVYYWLPLWVHMGLIYYLSSRSSFPVDVPDWFYYADKAAHFVIYSLLTLLALRAYSYGLRRGLTLGAYAAVIGFVALYGLTDEWHQAFVPGRSPALDDWLTDTLAAFAVCSAAGLWKTCRTNSDCIHEKS